MSTGEKAHSHPTRAGVVSQILVNEDGRIFVSNLSPELLEALKDCCTGDAFFAARFEELEKFRCRKE